MRLKKVKELSGWIGEVWLVKDQITGQHYAVSRAQTFDRGDETMIFKCGPYGENIDWSGVFQGLRIDHEGAIKAFEDEWSGK